MSMHERMESIADLHVAGGLAADERREADQHAAACAACSALLSDARAFSSWARGTIAPDAPPADLEDRLIARFRAAGRTKTRRFPVSNRVLKLTASIAAAVALVFLGNGFSVHAGMGRPEELSTTGWAEHGEKTIDDLTRSRSDLELYFSKDLGVAVAGKLPGLAGEGKGEGGGSHFALRGGGRNATAAAPADGAEADRRSLGEVTQLSRNLNRGGNDKLQLAETPGPEESLKKTSAQQETRKIIRNGDVSLEVDAYEATYLKLAELVAAEKGQISSANTQKMANGKVRATVTLRIPPERFDAVLAKLRDFGTVRNQNIGSEDVTKAYIDLESRLKSKEILSERLRKLLAESKGTVKELMEVEVQLSATNEAIEKIKGEIKYYDNLVGLATLILRIAEKDLGQPFEYVQTLQSTLALTARDPDDAYAKAQKEILAAGGQVVDSKMTRQSDGASTGSIRARVDAEKFPALREALRALGTVTNDTVNQQKTARGGNEGAPKADAPLRKEQAVIDLTVSSPPLFVTRRSQILIETAEVESAYQNSRRVIEAAGGKIVDGSLTGRADGMSATLKAQVDADKFAALVESLKSAGKVKNANVNHVLPAVSPDGAAALLRERAEIELALISPPQLIGEEHGILKTVRDTFANSWTGLLWSIEKLFVGISLAGPWVALAGAAWLLWRRSRRAKASSPAP